MDVLEVLAILVRLSCWFALTCSLIENDPDIRKISIEAAQLVMVTIVVFFSFFRRKRNV